MRLAAQLITGSLAIAAAAATTSVVVGYRAERARQREALETVQSQDIRRLEMVAREARLSGQEIGLLHYVRTLAASDPAVGAAYVADRAGRFVVHSDADLVGRRAGAAGRLHVHSAALPDGWTAGIEYRPDVLNANLREQLSAYLVRTTALTGSALVIWTALVIFFIRHLAGRFGAMADAAHQVGAGQLDARVGIHGDDELDRLGRDFNRMAEKLEATETRKGRFLAAVAQAPGAAPAADILSRLAKAAGGVLRAGQATLHVEPNGDGIARRVLDTGQPYLTDAVLAVPLLLRGRAAGVLEFRDRPGGFRPDDLPLAREMAGLTALAYERERLVQELQTSNLALRDVDRLRSEFITNVSHELRTPLMSLSGALEILERSQSAPSDFLIVVRRSYLRLERQVKNILSLTSLEAGRGRPACSPIDLRRGIEAALAQFNLAFHEKGLRMVTDLDPALPVIQADQDLLDQVLANLLANAGKFTPPGGTVGVTARPDGPAGVRIGVWDTGPGIPEAYREKIFEKFFRVPSAARTTGTGIGLAIVRGIVERHGGRVWVEERMGGGAQFQMTWPLQPPEEET